MSPFRPDLIDCWIYRDGPAGAEILLIRRAPGRILPGLWQCVSGKLEPGERIAEGALREVAEETAFAGDAILAFYDLDLVNQFHEPSFDAVVTSAVFAVRVAPRRRAATCRTSTTALGGWPCPTRTVTSCGRVIAPQSNGSGMTCLILPAGRGSS